MSTVAYQRLTIQAPASRDRHLHAVPAPAPTGAPLRLTRRGKVVLVTFVLGILALLSVALGTSVAASDQAAVAQDTVQVQVQPGQTLWQIAAQANPHGDIRSTIDDIVKLNALPNASGLTMGTTLAVPVYDR